MLSHLRSSETLLCRAFEDPMGAAPRAGIGYQWAGWSTCASALARLALGFHSGSKTNAFARHGGKARLQVSSNGLPQATSSLMP